MHRKEKAGWGTKVCSPHVLRSPCTAVHCVHHEEYLWLSQHEEGLLWWDWFHLRGPWNTHAHLKFSRTFIKSQISMGSWKSILQQKTPTLSVAQIHTPHSRLENERISWNPHWESKMRLSVKTRRQGCPPPSYTPSLIPALALCKFIFKNVDAPFSESDLKIYSCMPVAVMCM